MQYIPPSLGFSGYYPPKPSFGEATAGATGFEPATYCVTGNRSNQLSYAPKYTK